jgi:glycosyltransferase involved in cell wall biosynthesis
MTNSFPLVSFIVATKNSQYRLPDLLDSIKNNCPPHHYEVLIADCSSSDNTVNLVHSYSLMLPIRIVSLSDSGIYNAWNRAIRHAVGSWYIFLGDDDKIHNSQEAPACFDFLASLEPISHQLVLFDAYLLSPASTHVIPSYSPSLLWKGMKFYHPSSAISALVFNDYKFDENLRVSSDYKLFSILRLHGLYCPRTLTSIGQGGISHTSLFLLFKEILGFNLSIYSNPYHIVYYPLKILIYACLRNFKKSLLEVVCKTSHCRLPIE